MTLCSTWDQSEVLLTHTSGQACPKRYAICLLPSVITIVCVAYDIACSRFACCFCYRLAIV